MVNAAGECYLTHTRVGGRYALRIAIGAPGTQRHHVAAAWRQVTAAAAAVLG